jgi:hypothetical protein
MSHGFVGQGRHAISFPPSHIGMKRVRGANGQPIIARG